MQAEQVFVGQLERVLALRSFQAFRELSPAELATIAEHTRPRLFPRGALLLREDRPVRALYFIVQGLVEVSKQGTESARRLVAHETVGALAALTDNPHGERAVALEDTITLEFDRDDMEEVFEDNFPIFLAALRSLAVTHLRLRKRLGPGAGFVPVTEDGSETRSTEPLGLAERIMLLRSTMSFAQARIEALADIAQEAREISVARGQELWRLGDSATYILVVTEGRLLCTTENQAQRFEIGNKSLAGGLDALAGQPRWYDAVAATPFRALRIEIQSLLDVIEDNMEMAIDILRVFAQVILELEDRAAPGNQVVAEATL